jgi:hypothetical protein
MILIGHNRSTRRKLCPSTNFSTTNLGWTGPRLNPGLSGDGPATKRPNLSTAYEFSVRRYIGSSIRESKQRPIKYNADMLAPTTRTWIHVFESIRCEIQCDHVVYAACRGTSSIHPSIHPSTYGATAPSGPWPPSEDASILLCLPFVTSVLVYLESVTCPSGRRPPILLLVFPMILY